MRDTSDPPFDVALPHVVQVDEQVVNVVQVDTKDVVAATDVHKQEQSRAQPRRSVSLSLNAVLLLVL